MKLFFTLLLTMTAGFSFGMTPPDTTASIIEKGTAKYLIAEGKRNYNEGNTRIALVKFREALDKNRGNAEATYWLAECHILLGNYEKARTYAEEALAKDPGVHQDAHNLLGRCLHRLGELDAAIDNYTKALGVLSKTRANELQVQFHIDQCELAKGMIASPKAVKISRMSPMINTAADETAPVFSPDGKTLYFVSRRADNIGGGISPGDQRFFEDIYVSIWNEETKSWGEATNSSDLLSRVNTKGMDAISYITPDGKELYMTINTEVLESPKPKTKHSDIFYCKLNRKGTWNSPKSIGKPINTFMFDAAISMTADGSTAYFVSERQGGEGRSDIWVSYRSGNTWSKPENLGKTINTPGNETTVYTTPDGEYLFFSSTGHKGMGGYDVYVSKNNGDTWSEPQNLGYPINTVADETHFVYYPDQKKAYYSAFTTKENRGLGARDLFEIDMTNYELP